MALKYFVLTIAILALVTSISHASDPSPLGVITIANAVFGSDPPINDDVLAKAFQIDKKVVDYLQSQFCTSKYSVLQQLLADHCSFSYKTRLRSIFI
ncbi:hypothetical protein HAX54_023748 [Datura stramonium]|uniref:Uncharacterized protein n=1 Tax=Datura stramonium TaxID=4076 RepID=A0ABS8UX23_DATST|nr:hypothetical protein [Datura stramonium]